MVGRTPLIINYTYLLEFKEETQHESWMGFKQWMFIYSTILVVWEKNIVWLNFSIAIEMAILEHFSNH